MPFIETPAATLHVPDRLFHGTCGNRLARILDEGLRSDLAKESGLSQDAVYLATDPARAAKAARRRAARHGGEPVVLAVAVESLDGRLLCLDHNLSWGRHCSGSLAYAGRIAPMHLAVEPWAFLSGLAAPDAALDGPDPGRDVVAFDLAWERAAEFIPVQPAPGR